ncbi:MAG: hypothetical protein HXY22_00785 [Alphaproteobacteria bacterium]|nr:hypothetical protein [Alphaproteobacteria bacterium]
MIRSLIAGALALLYVVLWVWWGGDGTPLSREEGEAFVAELHRIHGDMGANPEFYPNLAAWIARDDGAEFVMVNLETFKDDGNAAAEADRRYARGIVPLLFAHGSAPIFIGYPSGLLFGEKARNVDRVALVRYRSLRDFLKVVTHPAMEELTVFKWASLSRTEIFPVRTFWALNAFRALTGALFLALILIALFLRRS